MTAINKQKAFAGKGDNNETDEAFSQVERLRPWV
jgi:hypothetical protein